jgi:phosphoribosylformimino-5-aminoimidazole carboxamide ribotide isomerase
VADFELIPAIDLLGGRCVRLTQGRYEEATVYGVDPAEVARRFLRAGIRRLHVVDLDGAKQGHPVNGAAIRAILAEAGRVPLQLGGGLRSAAAIDAALELGVERVVLGTAALREPALVAEAARRHPGRVALGIDARAGRVAVGGWLETSELQAVELARRYEDAGVAALVYTDIERDGMLSGPNLEATAALAASVRIPVIASGGVGTLDDVRRAAALAKRGVAGLIVGRALLSGALDLTAALEAAACC